MTKVQDQLCIPYNLPAPTSQLLHPGLNICTGQEEVDGEVDGETVSKTKYKSDEECLEECGHRSFSTRMSSAKFEDSGDFFYSALLRRPGLALPAASPKFWAEYVQYVNSLGNSTVLGPPRCCICQNKDKEVLFSGEVYWGLHALKKLWVLEQIGLWILRSKTWKYISKGQEKARKDDSPSRQAQSKWSENFVRDLCFFLISIVMWQSSILGIERSTLDEKVSTEELVQRLSLAFLCLWVASAILPSLSFLLARSKNNRIRLFSVYSCYNLLLFRCPAISSSDNVEKGGGEDRDERERKSKMFDTVFIPASTNTASWLLREEKQNILNGFCSCNSW